MATFEDLIAGKAEPVLRRSVIDPVTGRPYSLTAPTGEVVQRASVLPVGRDDTGQLVPAVPSMLMNAAEAAALPGQVARGEFSIFDPRTGHVSDEAIGKAADLAGLAMTGSLPFGAPKGALRSFGGSAQHADDPLAALEAMLSGIKPEAPPPGPHLLDPNAKSWDLYHGSGAGPDFARFDPSLANNPAERGAVFFAPDAETASGYASGSGAGAPAGPRVFRTTVEPGKTDVFDIGHLAETDPAFNARAREIMSADSPIHAQTFDNYMDNFRASRADDARVMQQMREMGLEPDPNFGTRMSYGHGHIGAAIERAKAQGLDTAILRGLVEHGGDDQVVALTPGRVRSYYSPDQVLYSGGPGGVVAGSVANSSGDTSNTKAGSTMAGLFDDVAEAGPTPAPSAGKSRPSLFDDVPEAKPSALARAGAVAADVVNSAGAGLIRGAAGLVDLPQNIYGLVQKGVDVTTDGAISALGGTPAPNDGSAPRIRGLIPSPADLPRPGETAIHALEAVTEPLYKPKTMAGEYAGTIAEFVPGAGAGKALEAGVAAGAKTLAKTVAAPAIASETAGQVTKGTELEPWARGAAGIGAGVGVALAGRPGVAERAFDRSAGKISPEEVGQVQSLVADAKARGIDLTWPEALQQVVGPRRMGDLLRVVEGQGKLQDFFAARPDQIRAAGEGGLDAIAPAGPPGQVGDAAQAAARNAVAATPEGQAVIRASQGAGTRTTADQAGQVIQREMRGVADAREAQRSEQAARDYALAREAPERVGVDRTVTVERPGEPVLQTLDIAPAKGPEFQPPPDGPATIGSLAPKRPDAPQGAGARGPSLARFISENGGIGLERGDVKAAGLDRVRQPGVANLVRQDGKSIDDFWRERLIEEGYLPPDRDGGMARNIHDELISLLEEEARGRKTYPYDYLGRDDLNGFGAAKDEFANAAGQATKDVREALTAAEIDPRSVHKDFIDRAAAELMRGDETDPLKAFERVVMASREPAARPASRLVPTTVTEEISAPRFGQANPQPAIDVIDRALDSAKGDVRRQLEALRNDLHSNRADPVSGVRETDLSIDGLHQARERLDQVIRRAVEEGDGVLANRLQGARAALDEQLKAAPEMAAADARFVANSRPLDPFTGNRPLARATAREPRAGGEPGPFVTPAEQVPSNLQGATAAREFLRDATPEARRAFQDREVTRILDTASTGEGATATRIRSAMRQNEDLLSQLPEARGRLQRLANAYQAREAIDRSPLGRIAERPDVKNAMDALFPVKPVEGSAREVGEAVAGMVRSNAVAARQLVRTYLATEFAASKPGAQTGGAKFAARMTDNPLRSENVSAAIRALPNGEALERGFNRLIEIMQATGQRQGIGSRTSFNNEALAELRTGSAPAQAAEAAATGGLKLPGRIADALQTWRLGKNLDRLAELMTTAEGGRRLAQLADAKTGASTIALLNTITRSAAHGMERARESADEPLRLTVRPGQ